MKEKRLSQLSVGQSAKIIRFENSDASLKLLEMGCLPGETVTLEQIAPLGDPISISVAGYSLSIRNSEAQTIIVESIN